ncbi:hypothetical protein FALCPG4_005937 [Fusarium falciforme]
MQHSPMPNKGTFCSLSLPTINREQVFSGLKRCFICRKENKEKELVRFCPRAHSCEHHLKFSKSVRLGANSSTTTPSLRNRDYPRPSVHQPAQDPTKASTHTASCA